MASEYVLKLSIEELPPGTRVIKIEPGSKIPRNAIPVEFKDAFNFAKQNMKKSAYDKETKEENSVYRSSLSQTDYRSSPVAEHLIGHSDNVVLNDANAAENGSPANGKVSKKDNLKNSKEPQNRLIPNQMISRGINDDSSNTNLGARDKQYWNTFYNKGARKHFYTYQSNDFYGIEGQTSTELNLHLKYTPYFEKYITPRQMTLVPSDHEETQQSESNGSDLYTDSSSDILIQLHESDA